jgi:deoxycytidylate deaminase
VGCRSGCANRLVGSCLNDEDIVATCYKEIISSGANPSRSGAKRIAQAVLAAGWRLAVASTSANLRSRRCLFHTVGKGTAKRFTSLAGDIVTAKSPLLTFIFSP